MRGTLVIRTSDGPESQVSRYAYTFFYFDYYIPSRQCVSKNVSPVKHKGVHTDTVPTAQKRIEFVMKHNQPQL